jgi:hypothetical protein
LADIASVSSSHQEFSAYILWSHVFLAPIFHVGTGLDHDVIVWARLQFERPLLLFYFVLHLGRVESQTNQSLHVKYNCPRSRNISRLELRGPANEFLFRRVAIALFPQDTRRKRFVLAFNRQYNGLVVFPNRHLRQRGAKVNADNHIIVRGASHCQSVRVV